MVTFRNRFALALIAIAASTVVHAVGWPANSRRRRRYSPRRRPPPARQRIRRNCATCHQPDLRGQGTAPPLAGPEFIGAWGSRTTSDLLSFIQLTMPPASPGALSADIYANIAAFILQSNGARAGNQPLTRERTSVAINTVATGQARRARRPRRHGAGGAARRRPRPGPRRAAPPGGITVAGEVKNYVPVTDAMLRNPDPGDWLMIRRDYRASNYSPLNADHARQRQGSAARLVVGDERRRHESARAARSQRRRLSQ